MNRPKIYNVTLTTAGTEYTHTFDHAYFGVFTVQLRTANDLQMAFTATQSGTTYFTIPAGSSYTFDVGLAGVLNIYFQCQVSNVVVEILAYE